MEIESMVTPIFATLVFDDIISLLKSIRRQNRATMSEGGLALLKIRWFQFALPGF
ncbi:hypothetical protein [Klebsiella aerogenes]|uniref:hypothetical protein n=1 Tax=Klebsiella aerogenes TaxID=548 RepID=UPI002448BD2C|nr:hypothetical protein [Klebsiella aerogenes]MDH1612576.1 hypothetical protein [Klebsiella aerogenes]